jgi:hypothetical protein
MNTSTVQRAPLACDPRHDCRCSDLPHALQVPDQLTTECLCPNSLVTMRDLRATHVRTSNDRDTVLVGH